MPPIAPSCRRTPYSVDCEIYRKSRNRKPRQRRRAKRGLPAERSEASPPGSEARPHRPGAKREASRRRPEARAKVIGRSPLQKNSKRFHQKAQGNHLFFYWGTSDFRLQTPFFIKKASTPDKKNRVAPLGGFRHFNLKKSPPPFLRRFFRWIFNFFPLFFCVVVRFSFVVAHYFVEAFVDYKVFFGYYIY